MHGHAKSVGDEKRTRLTRKLQLEELGRVSIADFKDQKKMPAVLVLDNIRSAHNVGAAFRTADAFALEQIVLTGITPVPPHPDITKSAIGATLSMDFMYEESIATALSQLKVSGYHIIGLEQTTSSVALQSFTWPERVALVVGNEVRGISDEALTHIDHFIEIPQFGTKHSLNVSVATGMMLWDYVRARIVAQESIY